MKSPAKYEGWYSTRRGRWIAEREYRLLSALLTPASRATLLDVGCGTGHFSRRFADAGLRVTGLDPDAAAVAFARRWVGVTYLRGDARDLPFADGAFEYCSAITSLCFVDDPAGAVREMWRVARRGIVLGLLYRGSLLHRQKAGQGGYRGARWDRYREAAAWFDELPGSPQLQRRWGIFLPGGGILARFGERVLPTTLPLGGFLALAAHKPEVARPGNHG